MKIERLNKIFKSKGAMFGLDARIALAIFGALSVISGAALYSAIQEARTVAFLAKLTEVEKAVEQYLLDTGSVPPLNAHTGNVFLDVTELVSSSVTGWNGPYLSYPIHTDSATVSMLSGEGTGDRFTILLGTSDSVTVGRTACTDLKVANCAIWLEWYEVADSLKEGIDVKVDGSTSANSGKVRVCPDPDCGTNGSILYKLDVK